MYSYKNNSYESIINVPKNLRENNVPCSLFIGNFQSFPCSVHWMSSWKTFWGVLRVANLISLNSIVSHVERWTVCFGVSNEISFKIPNGGMNTFNSGTISCLDLCILNQ